MNPTRIPLACALSAACLALAGAGSAGAGTVEALETVRVANDLSFPIYVTHAPGDYRRLYIIEKRGVIQVLDLETNTINATPFLDIDSIVTGGTATNSEQGLLGLAFHPEYQSNGLFYVNYTGSGGGTRVDELGTLSPDTADPESRRTVMIYSQPFSNHNGGWIGFRGTDPGNYLYVSAGDGGSAGDPNDRAQDITSQRLGKILRVDVDGRDVGGLYSIPPGNPFVGIAGDDEIWAYGVRNPWQCDFDSETGDFYIADVGQNAWEEISFEPGDSPGGQNYGWRCREAMHNFNTTGCPPLSEFVEPIYEYSHASGLSISGGGVYRGCDIPTLRGHYLFADFASGRTWSFRYDGAINDFATRTTELSPSREGFTVNQITSMGEDARGEMYIVDQGNGATGQIFRIVPAVPTIAAEDLNCNGTVEFADLLIVLGSWGECDLCPADINRDGVVGFSEILAILKNWG